MQHMRWCLMNEPEMARRSNGLSRVFADEKRPF
jgi:hypothetical protein